jgi:hypothetical protein
MRLWWVSVDIQLNPPNHTVGDVAWEVVVARTSGFEQLAQRLCGLFNMSAAAADRVR